MSNFKLYRSLRAADSDSFGEATAEELRVLVVLMESEGEALTYKEIASRASVSAARARSATELWRAEGVLADSPAAAASSDAEDNVRDEFAERFSSGIQEVRSVEAARTVRDGELAELLSECAGLLGKPALSTEEVKKITSIYSQLSLSAEYIFTLAAHLANNGRLTATNLAKRAESLAEKGVDTLEALCVYIEEEGKENGTDKEFRRLFGIWNRKLSRAERDYFKKWSEDFGYSTEIVGEAYGIMTSKNAGGGVNLKYIDTILTSWHEAGCTTVAQCRAENERQGAARAEKAEKTTSAPRKKSDPKQPQFVNFDVEDAFRRALERSYGKPKDDN